MKVIPRISQKNVHIFIPHKIAAITKRLNIEKNMPLNHAVVTFYNSETYAKLEKENTKCWHKSPAQLYEEYINANWRQK